MPTKTDDPFNQAVAIALKALARSDKLSCEIANLLSERGFEPEVVVQTLEHLKAKHILDDGRVVQQAMRQGRGDNAVKAKLIARGADGAVIDSVLSNEDERTRAELALLKYRYRDDAPKAARFLYSRGFSEETIESVLGEVTSSE